MAAISPWPQCVSRLDCVCLQLWFMGSREWFTYMPSWGSFHYQILTNYGMDMCIIEMLSIMHALN